MSEDEEVLVALKVLIRRLLINKSEDATFLVSSDTDDYQVKINLTQSEPSFNKKTIH